MNIPRHAMLTSLPLLFSVTLAGGCSTGDEALPKEVTSAIENAFARDDADALIAQFADDAQLLQPNAPIIRGRENVAAYWRDQVIPILSYDMTTVESRVFGDYAYHFATYTFRNVRRGSIVETGKVIEIWRKRDGKWQVYLTSWNQDRPPPGATMESVEAAGSGSRPSS
jgi:ketosteroid isomerase-like protein